METPIPGTDRDNYNAVYHHPVAGNLQWCDVRSASDPSGEEGGPAHAVVETVMSTIVAGLPKHCDVPSLSVPTSYACVRFSMRCPAREVYLLLGDEGGKAGALHKMEEGDKGRWDLVMRLRPGGYRYRYYAHDGIVPTHVRAEDADDAPIRMDCFASFAFSRNWLGTQPAVENYRA
jgi:hypothetical protein